MFLAFIYFRAVCIFYKVQLLSLQTGIQSQSALDSGWRSEGRSAGGRAKGMLPGQMRWLCPNRGGMHRVMLFRSCCSFLEQTSSVYWGEVPGQRTSGCLRHGSPFRSHQDLPPEQTWDSGKRKWVYRTWPSLEVGLV